MKPRVVYKHWKATQIMFLQCVFTLNFPSSLQVLRMGMFTYGMELLTGNSFVAQNFLISKKLTGHLGVLLQLEILYLLSNCRLENTLNYGFERVWAFGCMKGSNRQLSLFIFYFMIPSSVRRLLICSKAYKKQIVFVTIPS